jgi:hypothetical protein
VEPGVRFVPGVKAVKQVESHEGQEVIEISLTGATNALVDPDYMGPTSYYKYIYIRNDDDLAPVPPQTPPRASGVQPAESMPTHCR